jgi:anti-sigma B factor antagonist
MLAIRGGLDIATLSQLESHLDELKKAGRLKVIVELADLNFIRSSGLGVFLSTVNHFRKGGGDLVFLNLNTKIQKIFSMVGFMRVLTVLTSHEEAVKI